MKLKEWKDVGRNYTEKASNISRSLVLSGVGIIWVIQDGNEAISIMNPILIWPLFFLACAIFMDFLHYFIAGHLWLAYYNNKLDLGNSVEDDFDGDKWRKSVVYILYYLKIVLMVVAYFFVIRAIILLYCI